MLSIIVCSAKDEVYRVLEANIAQTVGIAYEVIKIANGNAAMGIAEAYNKGASRVQYPYLCFVHEDVEFVTKDWGKLMVDFFEKNPIVGIAGFAGSKYKSKYISGWSSGNMELERSHLFHRFSDGNLAAFTNNPKRESFSEVTVLDGVCLCMPYKIWQKFPFNEMVAGFHFYDIDISLRITNVGYKAAVLFFIDLIHFSKGGFNNDWLEKGFIFHKRKDVQGFLERQELKKPSALLDKEIKLFWSQRLVNEKISLLNRFKLLVIHYQKPLMFLKIGSKFIKRKLFS